MIHRWEELKDACLHCRNCSLCDTRNHVVFGAGNPQAKILFVGEGPGENEDLQGEAFVGRGGQYLDKLLAAVDLDSVHYKYREMPSSGESRSSAGGAGSLYRVAA